MEFNSGFKGLNISAAQSLEVLQTIGLLMRFRIILCSDVCKLYMYVGKLKYWLINQSPFMEPADSLPCSKATTSGLYADSDEPTPHSRIVCTSEAVHYIPTSCSCVPRVRFITTVHVNYLSYQLIFPFSWFLYLAIAWFCHIFWFVAFFVSVFSSFILLFLSFTLPFYLSLFHSF